MGSRLLEHLDIITAGPGMGALWVSIMHTPVHTQPSIGVHI